MRAIHRVQTVTVLSAMLAASPAGAAIWNLKNDFSITNGNPNGAWTYGWATTDFSVFTPYTNSGAPSGHPSWYGWGGDFTPAVWVNVGSEVVNEVPPGALSLHPGNGTEPCIARWTSPIGGSIHITGQFLPGNLGSMQVAIHRNGTPIWSAVDSGSFDLEVVVAVDDRIDFAVFGAYFYGDTPASVTIQSLCQADLDGNGQVNGADLGLLLANWGTSNPVADLNGDGTVNGADLGLMLAAWGACS